MTVVREWFAGVVEFANYIVANVTILEFITYYAIGMVCLFVFYELSFSLLKFLLTLGLRSKNVYAFTMFKYHRELMGLRDYSTMGRWTLFLLVITLLLGMSGDDAANYPYVFAVWLSWMVVFIMLRVTSIRETLQIIVDFRLGLTRIVVSGPQNPKYDKHFTKNYASYDFKIVKNVKADEQDG